MLHVVKVVNSITSHSVDVKWLEVSVEYWLHVYHRELHSLRRQALLQNLKVDTSASQNQLLACACTMLLGMVHQRRYKRSCLITGWK